jgi:uncharacterized protein YndB with AHSA1/START domain
MPDILHYIKIEAEPERAFRAISTSEGIRSWWTRDADVDTLAGGCGEFRFYDRKSITRVRIEELMPSEHVRWHTLSANAGGWTGTTITFELRAEGNGTILLFAHRGFAEADDWFARTTTGWAYYLVSLQQYLETGKGAPHPDIDFARVIR